jgi:hypothetical protein
MTVTTATATAADTAQFEAWGRAMIETIEQGHRVDIWNTAALRAARKSIPDDLELFRGPYRNVRPYLTTELRELIDQGAVTRWTVTEWRAAARREREAEAVEVGDNGGAAHALGMLDTVREYMAKRAEWIATAREASPPVPWSEICKASGLSRSQAGLLYSEHVKDRAEAAVLASVGEVF